MDKQLLERLHNENIITRSALINTSNNNVDENNRSVRTVLATETPATIYDWQRDEVVSEILLIAENSVIIPQSRQVPMLDSHSRYSVDDVKGSIRDLQIIGTELVGFSHFASDSESEYNKVKDGHITDVSVGYRVFEQHTAVLLKGENAIVEGRNIANNTESTMLVRTKWEVMEGSLVVIGADENAEFRSFNHNNKQIKITKGVEMTTEEMKAQLDQERAEARNNEQQRIREITAIASNFKGRVANLETKSAEYVKEGKTVEEFRAYVLDNIQSGEVGKSVSEIGMSRKDVQNFSLFRAINAVASGNWKGAEFEREVTEQVNAQVGRNPQSKGFYLPREIQIALQGRAMLAGSGAGANIVPSGYSEGEFVEVLRSQLALGKAGARILTGLTDNFVVGKQTTPATISMVAEGAAPASATSLGLAQLEGTPKTATAYVDFSRRLLTQSSPSIEKLIMGDLTAQHNVKKDYMALYGAGTNEPTGIANTSGIGTVDMTAACDWAKIVAHETNIETTNVAVDGLKWITNSAIKGKMKTSEKSTSTGLYLMNENGEMNGYGSIISSIVQNRDLFFGNWSDLLILVWGVTQIIVDEYSLASSGQIRVVSQEEFDVLVRRAGSFSLSQLIVA